jgi:hypothetical protein
MLVAFAKVLAREIVKTFLLDLAWVPLPELHQLLLGRIFIVKIWQNVAKYIFVDIWAKRGIYLVTGTYTGIAVNTRRKSH